MVSGNKITSYDTFKVYQPITFHSISLLQQDLWGNIVRSSNSRISLQNYHIEGLNNRNPSGIPTDTTNTHEGRNDRWTRGRPSMSKDFL